MYEIDKAKFGAFVAALRKERGYTQKDLAEKLYLSDKAISKWETGVSIPDISLLVPLSELLGVTVTELLLCRRMEAQAALDPEQVEGVVKTALGYSGEKPGRAYQTKSWWPVLFLLCLAAGILLVYLCAQRQLLTEAISTGLVLETLFGGYFCCMVRTRLPAFYDENRWGLYYDGLIRMNVPGVAFTNSNWPYIVLVVRIWCCVSLVLFPALSLVLGSMNRELWLQVEKYVFLLIVLGGLFLPVYFVGRKYE